MGRCPEYSVVIRAAAAPIGALGLTRNSPWIPKGATGEPEGEPVASLGETEPTRACDSGHDTPPCTQGGIGEGAVPRERPAGNVRSAANSSACLGSAN